MVVFAPRAQLLPNESARDFALCRGGTRTWLAVRPRSGGAGDDRRKERRHSERNKEKCVLDGGRLAQAKPWPGDALVVLKPVRPRAAAACF